ncbi:hypothetical protein [Microvirga roseola]|uniref:hypothetical protein n=1 Tax=Microvirga roseola TaxID=2883126 RepID=UPI001E4C466F|nr:hypothetical protein [Microvirga roseola]
MRDARRITFAAGALIIMLTTTGLAAQDPSHAPERQVPTMGMMQQMSQMMENCNRMMQAHLAQPHHEPEQQPRNNQ